MASRKNDIPALRCAIYTRKSTEERLEQELNSLRPVAGMLADFHRSPNPPLNP